MTPAIRAVTGDDAAALAPLATQLGYPVEAGELRARLDARGEGVEVLVSVEDSRIVGFVIVGVETDVLLGHRGRILGLVVDERQRGAGIGADLLDAAERWCSQRGAACIDVSSNIVRTRAHPFYERRGYERYKTQHVLRKNLPGRSAQAADRAKGAVADPVGNRIEPIRGDNPVPAKLS